MNSHRPSSSNSSRHKRGKPGGYKERRPSRSREPENGTPLSLAERISREINHSIEQRPSEGDGDQTQETNVTLISQMPLTELRELAVQEEIADAESLEKSALVFEVLSSRVAKNGVLHGQGTLEVLPDGFGFLRSVNHHYLSCPEDIYVSPSQIRKFGIRTGSVVCGQIRPPKDRERYFALLRVDTIDGHAPGDFGERKNFDELTPLHPEERIVLEFDEQNYSTRIVDLITPIGFGQRGLIVSPPRAGKTMLMQNMSRAVLTNHPNAYVIMLLVDERPEEVTDVERDIKGERCEVISSTFDEAPARHIQVADMVLEKAKRMVESGCDVVIFLDSITRLGRAWNQECQSSGKLLSGGLDANALQKPKAFFGSARKVEEGGSLTIVATALVDTGSKMDDVIFEEFKGTGNMEIMLDRSLVDRRIWPAIDINRSGTRREERLLDADEFDRICMMRRVISELNPPDAMEKLLNKLKKSKTNAEFLMSLNPSTL